MSDIKRYSSDEDEDSEGRMHIIGMFEASDGEYVKFVEHESECAALRADVERLTSELAQREYANPFAEARGIDVDAPTAKDWEAACRNANKLLGETELERKALRAEAERLRALASTQPMGQPVCDGYCKAAESRLAYATELLRRWMPVTPPRNVGGRSAAIVTDTETFLATQPAAPEKTNG